MTQNEQVYAICYQPGADGDVISGRNVKTVTGYAAVDFEVTSSSSFRLIYLKQYPFVTAAKTDIDHSCKRKRFRVSLKNRRCKDQ